MQFDWPKKERENIWTNQIPFFVGLLIPALGVGVAWMVNIRLVGCTSPLCFLLYRHGVDPKIPVSGWQSCMLRLTLSWVV